MDQCSSNLNPFEVPCTVHCDSPTKNHNTARCFYLHSAVPQTYIKFLVLQFIFTYDRGNLDVVADEGTRPGIRGRSQFRVRSNGMRRQRRGLISHSATHVHPHLLRLNKHIAAVVFSREKKKVSTTFSFSSARKAYRPYLVRIRDLDWANANQIIHSLVNRLRFGVQKAILATGADMALQFPSLGYRYRFVYTVMSIVVCRMGSLYEKRDSVNKTEMRC